MAEQNGNIGVEVVPGMRVRRLGDPRRRIAALQGRGVRDAVVDFGMPEIDDQLPGGGLAPDSWRSRDRRPPALPGRSRGMF